MRSRRIPYPTETDSQVSLTPFNTSMPLIKPPKLSKRFQMSYKEDEVDFFEQVENELMERLKIKTRCGLHKIAILNFEESTNGKLPTRMRLTA